MTRVRQALLDSDFCRKLRGKIPKEAFIIPDDLVARKTNYPTTLMKEFPADNSPYSYLGIISETLLQIRDSEGDIDIRDLNTVCIEVCGNSIPEKTLKLASTVRFIENINNTRKLLLSSTLGESKEYNKQIKISGCSIEGHPDIICGNKILEVKTTGQLKTGWSQFLLQTFCYGALYPEATTVHLVFPLSEYIWSWNIKEKWPKRNLYLDVLKTHGVEDKDKPVSNKNFQTAIMSTFNIGSHIGKKSTLSATVKGLPGGIPFQIFLSKATKCEVKDVDLAETLSLVEQKNIIMYVHSPYLLNLCIEPDLENNYVVESLRKQLRYAGAAGFKGVVVHVGKACKKPTMEAISAMRQNILNCLDAASSECPLLLETPAGQGTELLTKLIDFKEFIESIDDNRLGICIDTCHVFASGTRPSEYLSSIIKNNNLGKRLKLIHFNDSKGKCASCVDRHEALGCGWIGQEELIKCAELGRDHSIPMLLE